MTLRNIRPRPIYHHRNNMKSFLEIMCILKPLNLQSMKKNQSVGFGKDLFIIDNNIMMKMAIFIYIFISKINDKCS